jgi:hypothetical protein
MTDFRSFLLVTPPTFVTVATGESDSYNSHQPKF